MSSVPEGRALPFPVRWERSRSAASAPAQAEEISDALALARLQAGDSNALNVIFDHYSRLVRHVALSILRDFGEAEDLVQDIFFYVYRKAGLFDPAKGQPKAWILQIAYHRSLDRRAYLTRRGFYVGTEIEFLDDTLVGAINVERDVAAKLNRVQLEKAFQRLPETQRRTLQLYYFEGLELREIAERLNEPLPNVRHHYYRGLERLRQNAFLRKLWESERGK